MGQRPGIDLQIHRDAALGVIDHHVAVRDPGERIAAPAEPPADGALGGDYSLRARPCAKLHAECLVGQPFGGLFLCLRLEHQGETREPVDRAGIEGQRDRCVLFRRRLSRFDRQGHARIVIALGAQHIADTVLIALRAAAQQLKAFNRLLLADFDLCHLPDGAADVLQCLIFEGFEIRGVADFGPHRGGMQAKTGEEDQQKKAHRIFGSDHPRLRCG